MNFTFTLLNWYQHHKRDLPWRNSSNAYQIWLSEIILQQTRVSQGLDYYYKFLEAFPCITDLAEATEDQVLALWQGLGYYSRARNMHFTAKYVVQHHQAVFPSKISQLQLLKGIGKYTAAAIASMAYNVPVAAVDGNVARVISRYFMLDSSPSGSSELNRQVTELAQQLIDPQKPGMFNQALMDFGSIICKPSQPLCIHCPLALGCSARKHACQNLIPLKKNPLKKRIRHLHYLYISNADTKEFLIEKRTANDIWKNLYQLPLIENQSEQLTRDDLLRHPTLKYLADESKNEIMPVFLQRVDHKLTHQHLKVYFYRLLFKQLIWDKFVPTYQLIHYNEFSEYGMSVVISRFLKEIGDKEFLIYV
jgi:A/G-specific adenine glycosylase